ncbi:MAG: hypothetical protein GY946_26750 [bacterium]|nr:hypothetical protein [bacterium]
MHVPSKPGFIDAGLRHATLAANPLLELDRRRPCDFSPGVGMLRELSGSDWQGLLGTPDERVPEILILRGTRNLKHYYGIHAERFNSVMHVGSPNGLIDDLIIGDLGGHQIAYASVHGPAMA